MKNYKVRRTRGTRLPPSAASSSSQRPRQVDDPLNLAARLPRAFRAAAVRCDASKRDAAASSVTRRDAAMGLGAALLGAFVAPTAANAVECTWAIGCMPGTEPGAPPRYTMPGPAYSPAEAAEERFRAKIRAEKEAEQSAFNKRMAAQEEAAAAKAAEKAAADAAAEAAAKAAAEAAAAQ